MLIGTASVEELAARRPVVESFDGEPALCEGGDVLYVTYEIATGHEEAMLPPGLHPTDPPIVTWVFHRFAGSPWGPFAMAQTRIECRSGLRLRGFLVSAVVDNPEAAVALGKRWGYTTRAGTIELRRHYDSARAMAIVDDRVVLDLALTHAEPLSPNDLQYVANMNLARTPLGVRLLQVEPRYEFHRVERWRPQVLAFDGAAWGDARIHPVYPVSASLASADVTLPPIRFVCRPDVLAFEGTESVRR
jgi:hypothetical protein